MPEPPLGSEMKSGRLVQDGKDNDDYESNTVKGSAAIQLNHWLVVTPLLLVVFFIVNENEQPETAT